MNKRILILCEAIAPPAYSPRIITLVEYLQQHGWHCEIVTEMDNDTLFKSDVCTIHQMPTYHNLIADKLFGAKEKKLFQYACKQVDVASFDLIFSKKSGMFLFFASANRLSKSSIVPNKGFISK